METKEIIFNHCVRLTIYSLLIGCLVYIYKGGITDLVGFMYEQHTKHWEALIFFYISILSGLTMLIVGPMIIMEPEIKK